MRRTLAYWPAMLGAVVTMVQVQAVIADIEWSDIPYIEGRYSRIYFDYLTSGNTGTFYLMNDWIVNQDDGGVNGGLKPDEYNRFNFSLAGSNYEIRVYRDGSADIFGGTLNNFHSACAWTTTPNGDVLHATWEISFEASGTIATLQGSDPKGLTIVPDPNPPAVPSIITAGPSAFGHWINGYFDGYPGLSAPVPNPTRVYQDPVRDSWFDEHDIGWTIILNPHGGVTIRTIPAPGAALLLMIGLGLAGAAKRRLG